VLQHAAGDLYNRNGSMQLQHNHNIKPTTEGLFDMPKGFDITLNQDITLTYLNIHKNSLKIN
jgi:hypothetical protein